MKPPPLSKRWREHSCTTILRTGPQPCGSLWSVVVVLYYHYARVQGNQKGCAVTNKEQSTEQTSQAGRQEWNL